jgi:GNAT superfamily N-acetyltransferase
MLRDGYTPIEGGRIAAVVTALQMRAPPRAAEPAPLPGGVAIRQVTAPPLAWYRDLFTRIGEDLLWFSRLRMPDAELAAILASADVEIVALEVDGVAKGLLELDFREPETCELAFFGLTPDLVGRGFGRALMARAIEQAFARPIARFWVHTCTFDHPSALDFYVKAGFTPFARMIEVTADPRLTGDLPRHAAPRIPLIEPMPEG